MSVHDHSGKPVTHPAPNGLGMSAPIGQICRSAAFFNSRRNRQIQPITLPAPLLSTESFSHSDYTGASAYAFIVMILQRMKFPIGITKFGNCLVASTYSFALETAGDIKLCDREEYKQLGFYTLPSWVSSLGNINTMSTGEFTFPVSSPYSQTFTVAGAPECVLVGNILKIGNNRLSVRLIIMGAILTFQFSPIDCTSDVVIYTTHGLKVFEYIHDPQSPRQILARAEVDKFNSNCFRIVGPMCDDGRTYEPSIMYEVSKDITLVQSLGCLNEIECVDQFGNIVDYIVCMLTYSAGAKLTPSFINVRSVVTVKQF